MSLKRGSPHVWPKLPRKQFETASKTRARMPSRSDSTDGHGDNVATTEETHSVHAPPLCAPVLFLDVDGVLNVSSTARPDCFSPLHLSLIDRVARVVHRCQAHVVLSSSWRQDHAMLASLRREWRRVGLQPFAGITPTIPLTEVIARLGDGVPRNAIIAAQRVMEIEKWLKANNCVGVPQKWVALDDLDLAASAVSLGLDPRRFLQTDPRSGLSVAHIEAAVEVLGETEASLDALHRKELCREAQALQSMADLLVVASDSDPEIAIIDTADFKILDTLRVGGTSFREWLGRQPLDFASDNVVRVRIKAIGDDCRSEHGELVLSTREESPGLFADRLAESTYVLETGCEQANQLSYVDVMRDLVTQLAEQRSATLADNGQRPSTEESVRALVQSVSSILQQPQDRQLGLIEAICDHWRSVYEAMDRRVLAEYVSRNEITSHGTINALCAYKEKCASRSLLSSEVDELLS